ncbi:MAG: Fe-S cluster assembly protein SufD [Verrucomicrobia bacterium]|nr:Fe-S cluster assembly protein SufD [Verrucomicrobiota bacterium]
MTTAADVTAEIELEESGPASAAPEATATGLFIRPPIQTDQPAWFQEKQFRAWETFEATRLPHRKDQEWRFTTLGKLDLSQYTPAPPLSAAENQALIARSHGNPQVAATMIFANDQVVQRPELSPELVAQGVVFAPLEDDLSSAHLHLMRKYFMANEAKLGSRKFSALHQAHVRTGCFIYVPKNVHIELPIEVFHWISGEGAATFPHTLLIAEEGSSVTLVDYHDSADRRQTGFTCGVSDLYVGPGAKVTYLAAQNWGEQVVNLKINTAEVGKDGHLTSLHVNLGGRYSRLESLNRLAGPGSRSDMLSSTVATGTQEFDQRTLQDHLAPHTTSDLLYKNSLSDQSKTIFSGLIKVAPEGQKTDAYQKVRNLMLSDAAEANSMPGLEILADDVRCTHGATAGHVDDAELFYLESRGIPRLKAQQLITQGFLTEILDRLNDERVTASLARLLNEKFARM